jgi:hypothetical protein
MIGGRVVEQLPSTEDARRTARERIAALPTPCHSPFEGEGAWPVELSPELESLYERVRKGIAS